MRRLRHRLINRWQKGYSMLELTATVAIIAVLAVIGISRYQNYVNRARQSEGKANLTAAYSSMKVFNAEFNDYTHRLDAIGFKPDGRLWYNIGHGVDRPPPATALGTWAGTATCIQTGGSAGGPACGWGANPWSNENSASSVTAMPYGATTSTTFSMYALGRINSTDIDSWDINETKTIRNLGGTVF